jgi:alpha(1,3/1,4) fucosyltransferase
MSSAVKPVNLFRLEAMNHTYFEDSMREYMGDRGIHFVDRIQDADVVMTRYFKGVTALRRCLHMARSRRRPRFMVWTDEPRYTVLMTPLVRGFAAIPDVHIMNCYSGDIYINNYYHCGWGMKRRENHSAEDGFSRDRKIVILAGYTASREAASLVVRGKELDFSWMRCHIACEGQRAGLVDIYGTGWPQGMALGQSRTAGDWMDQKLDLLKQYRFNLCFENTIYPFYCTEKIWHSILAGCLPIYYGAGTRIYDDFPRDSFIDYAEIKSPEELFEKVQSMTEDEYRRRMELCLEVYDRIYESRVWKKTWDTVLQNTILRLQQLVHG